MLLSVTFPHWSVLIARIRGHPAAIASNAVSSSLSQQATLSVLRFASPAPRATSDLVLTWLHHASETLSSLLSAANKPNCQSVSAVVPEYKQDSMMQS